MRPLHMAGAHADWALLATMNRPTDTEGLAAAARQLASTGLTPRDIASSLGLSEQAVSQLLRGVRGFTTIGITMTKNRMPTPRSTAAVQSQHGMPNFKPRHSGAIARVGSITPKVPPADKPKSQGVRRSLYISK